MAKWGLELIVALFSNYLLPPPSSVNIESNTSSTILPSMCNLRLLLPRAKFSAWDTLLPLLLLGLWEPQLNPASAANLHLPQTSASMRSYAKQTRAYMPGKSLFAHLMPHETTPASTRQSHHRNCHPLSSTVLRNRPDAMLPFCPCAEHIVRDLPLVHLKLSADGTLACIAFLVGYDGDGDVLEHVAQLRPVVADVHVFPSHHCHLLAHCNCHWIGIQCHYRTLLTSVGALLENTSTTLLFVDNESYSGWGRDPSSLTSMTLPSFISSLSCRYNTTVYVFWPEKKNPIHREVALHLRWDTAWWLPGHCWGVECALQGLLTTVDAHTGKQTCSQFCWKDAVVRIEPPCCYCRTDNSWDAKTKLAWSEEPFFCPGVDGRAWTPLPTLVVSQSVFWYDLPTFIDCILHHNVHRGHN